MGLGEIRKKDPAGIDFLILSKIHEQEEAEKHSKKMEREAKVKKGRRR